MTLFIAVSVGQCTTIVVPGWAAIGVVLAAAAPRAVQRLRSQKA